MPTDEQLANAATLVLARRRDLTADALLAAAVCTGELGPLDVPLDVALERIAVMLEASVRDQAS